MLETLTTIQKARAINEDMTAYGTFAEIGAGQETVRQFFRAGGASGTIAKAMSAYDKDFSLPSAPTSPVVQGMEMDGMIGLDWGFDETAVENTETLTSENFEFEGYVVYQLPSASSPLSEAVKVATYDRINLITTILDPAIDPNTGLVLEAAKQTGGDFGIQRSFEKSDQRIPKKNAKTLQK